MYYRCIIYNYYRSIIVYRYSYRCIIDGLDLYPTCYTCCSYWTFPGVDLWVLVILFFLRFTSCMRFATYFVCRIPLCFMGCIDVLQVIVFFWVANKNIIYNNIRKTNLNPLQPSKTISNRLKLWVSFTSWTTLRQWLGFLLSKNAGFGGPSAGGCRKSPGAVSMMLRELMAGHWDSLGLIITHLYVQ